jgi:hypothetical protein
MWKTQVRILRLFPLWLFSSQLHPLLNGCQRIVGHLQEQGPPLPLPHPHKHHTFHSYQFITTALRNGSDCPLVFVPIYWRLYKQPSEDLTRDHRLLLRWLCHPLGCLWSRLSEPFCHVRRVSYTERKDQEVCRSACLLLIRGSC